MTSFKHISQHLLTQKHPDVVTIHTTTTLHTIFINLKPFRFPRSFASQIMMKNYRFAQPYRQLPTFVSQKLHCQELNVKKVSSCFFFFVHSTRIWKKYRFFFSFHLLIYFFTLLIQCLFPHRMKMERANK